ncbi:MAG TPA: hypothetical protein VMD76_03550 [Candidatus Sulfotelmatobacter sp.]|nr:hypothetical protein [Candidatus Sulfotelmatobacter sp.]
MKLLFVSLLVVVSLTACNKSAVSPGGAAKSAPTDDAARNALVADLEKNSGDGARNCGTLAAHPTEDQSKAASDCAMQASQAKQPFYVAYEMPGMMIGVAGNAEGKLYTAHAEQTGSSWAQAGGNCPSELRVAASGRVTCFAPGDMGSMGGGHTAIPPGMPNPHAMPTR